MSRAETRKTLKNKGETVLRGKGCRANELDEERGANVSDIAKSGTVNGGVFGGVNAVLELVRAHPGLRANALASLSGKGLRTVKRYLGALVLLKQVVFRGAPKNGGYYVVSSK